MATILNVIQHYQRSIERSQNNEERLLHCISKLYKLPVKVQHLQDTGIGKTVNSLRKFNGEIGVAAKALVTKWKTMVAAEEELNATRSVNEKELPNNERSSNMIKEDKSNNDIGHSIDHSQVLNDKHETRFKHSSSIKEQHKDKQTEDTSDGNRIFSKHSKYAENSQVDATYEHKNRCPPAKPATASNSPIEHLKIVSQHRENDKKDKKHKDRGISKGTHSSHEKECLGEEKSSTATEHKHKSSSSHKKRKEDKDDKEHKKLHKSKRHHHNHSSENKHHETPADKHLQEKMSTSLSTTSASSSKHHDRSRGSKKDHDAEVNSLNHKKSAEKRSAILDDGIDSSMGANFADVLGMLNVPAKKMKKSNTPNSSLPSIKMELSNKDGKSQQINGFKKDLNSKKNSSSNSEPPDLLSSSAKLAPLDPSIVLELPSISTNYRPLPLNPTVMDCVFNTSTSSSSRVPARTLTNAEALSHGISSKTIRTKIYSGIRSGQTFQVPSLFDLCIRFLQKNIDALEYTGGVPFDILRPVLERASPQQLFAFEEYNPYLLEDSDVLWKQHVQRNYRAQKRLEMESWREMYLRCQEDQERKLSILAESIKQSQKIIAAPVRKTQLAFVDSMVKPPRNIQRKQEQYGTKSKLVATPAARVAALSSVTPNAAKLGDVRLRVAANTRDTAQVAHTPLKPKKAPLMAKALQVMRGRNKR